MCIHRYISIKCLETNCLTNEREQSKTLTGLNGTTTLATVAGSWARRVRAEMV